MSIDGKFAVVPKSVAHIPVLLQDPKHCATGCCQSERGTTCLSKLTEINDVGDPISLVQSREKNAVSAEVPTTGVAGWTDLVIG
jgi:hypothetical protein